jgi:hypothetical protein
LAVRKNTLVMVGIAVVFGLLAVFVAQGWLNYQAELSRKVVQPKQNRLRRAPSSSRQDQCVSARMSRRTT